MKSKNTQKNLFLGVYKEGYETHRSLFLTLAEGYIDLILQKKRLNLQSKWRAGLVDLPHG